MNRMRALIMLGVLSALLGLGGCASSIHMQKSVLEDSAASNRALVTFVRPSVFFGDGIGMNLWFDDQYAGVLKAGTLTQLALPPGSYLFLAQAENWSYVKADIVAGKSYYIKANLFPGVFKGRVALAVVKPDDDRVPEWQEKLDPVRPNMQERLAFQKAQQATIQQLIADFEQGKVSSYAILAPEDGR